MRPIVSRGNTTLAGAAVCVALAVVRAAATRSGEARRLRTVRSPERRRPRRRPPRSLRRRQRPLGHPMPGIRDLPASSDQGPADDGAARPVVARGARRARTCPQVVDLGGDAAFSLVAQTPYDEGPWRLERSRPRTEAPGRAAPRSRWAPSTWRPGTSGSPVVGPRKRPSSRAVPGRPSALWPSSASSHCPHPKNRYRTVYPLVVAGDGPSNTLWTGL